MLMLAIGTPIWSVAGLGLTGTALRRENGHERLS